MEAVAAGIEPGHFHDEECRAVFQFCIDHALKWKKPPSFAAVKDSAAGKQFGWEPSTDAFEFLTSQFVGQVKRRETLKGIVDIGRMLDDPKTDLTMIDDYLFETALRVTRSVPGLKAHEFRNMDQRIAAWRHEKQEGGWEGTRMGIPDFDNLTLGVQPGEFVSIAGWQGTGKSTLMTYVSWHAYLQDKTPLIFSLEMGAAQLMRKFDVMALNWQKQRADMVDHLRFKGHELSDTEVERWEQLGERVKNAKGNIVIIDDVSSPTVERVYAEAARRQPGMVCIDYVSLLQTPRQTDNLWQDLTRLTRQLKLMARNLDVPVWALAQTNVSGAAEGAQLSNIAYTRSLGQDSDIVLGLFSNEEMQKKHMMELRMLKNRDGRPCNTSMLWKPDVMHIEPWQEQFAFESRFA